MKRISLLITLTIALFLMTGVGNAWGQVSESFETGLPTSYTTTTSYSLSSGTWTGSTDQVVRGTTGVNTGDYSCQLRSQTGSQITTPTLSGGVGTISFYVTGSTSSGAMQIRVSEDDGENWTQVTGSPISFGTTKTFQSFVVNNSNVDKVQFYRTGATVYIDDVEISTFPGSGPADPQSFTATAASSTQINLAATANNNNDNILVAYNSVNTFGTPSGTYSAGNLITDGGTVHYVGPASSLTNHTGLSSGQTVYYKAWSVNGSTEYSTGVEANATTLKPEPTNHADNFAALANGYNQIDLTWSDNDGAQAADGFLIVGKTGAGTYLSVADGTDPADDTDWSDNNFNIKVAHGTQSYQVTGLTAETQYDFQIYPYTNSGTSIDFKTDGTVPEATATTDAAPATPIAWINEIHYDNNSTDVDELIEIVIKNSGDYDLSKFVVNLYNGNDGASYRSETVVNLVTGTSVGAYTFYTWSTTEIQNGAPDGVALSYDGTLIQFLSYEGNFTATGGPAIGIESTDIGVSETDTTPDGQSLQLSGTGTTYNDFAWQGPATATPGALNNNQFLLYETVWTGASTTDWNTAANWSNGIPTSSANTTIGNSGTVVISSSTEADCNNLTLNGSLTIKSDASGTGSLIINGTVSGVVTVERYLINYDNSTDAKYHFISSPVSNQAIRPEFVENTPATDVDFYKFDETLNTWINSKVSGGAWNSGFEANFAVGRGYLVAYPTAPVTKEFSGTLNNNASYTLTCTYTDGQGNGWNLLGNPYPAAIDWDAVTLGDGVDNALYYYDASTQNYIAYLRISGDAATSTGGSRYIPAGQGFMVHANNTGSTKTVTIEKADLTHSGQDVYYKSSTNLLSGSLSLQVTGNTFHDKTIIHFNEQATTDFDGNYDAFKLMSANMQVPMIYTSNEENVQFAINGLPKVEEGTSIPVSLRIGADETYTIEASINDIEMNVFLEDLTTGISTKLNESPTYSFTASEGDDPNRFLLHFGVVGLDENDSQGSLRAYTYNNTLYVQNSMEAANLRILDLQGRLLLEKQLNGQGLQSLPLDFPAGVYVVQLLNSKAQKSVKVIVE